jgi:hypothetical protein
VRRSQDDWGDELAVRLALGIRLADGSA